MLNVSLAAGTIKLLPPTVAVNVDVTLLYRLFTAPSGMFKVTLNVQLELAVKLPPVNIRKLVPDNVEPAPHGLTGKGASAVKPLSTSVRL